MIEVKITAQNAGELVGQVLDLANTLTAGRPGGSIAAPETPVEEPAPEAPAEEPRIAKIDVPSEVPRKKSGPKPKAEKAVEPKPEPVEEAAELTVDDVRKAMIKLSSNLGAASVQNLLKKHGAESASKVEDRAGFIAECEELIAGKATA